MGAHLHGEAQSWALITVTSSAAVCFSEQLCILPGAVQEHEAPDLRTSPGQGTAQLRSLPAPQV